MAIEQITTCELLRDVTENDTEPFLYDEISKFFEENFDFATWQWNCDLNEYWQLLDCYYPEKTNNSENLIYFDNAREKEILLQALAWVLDGLLNENSDDIKIIQALHLSIIVPNFWQFSYKAGIKFSTKSRNIVTSFIKQQGLEVKLGNNAHRHEKEFIEKLLEALDTHNWNEIHEYTQQLDGIYNLFIFSDISSCPFLFLIWQDKNKVMDIVNREMNTTRLLAWLSYIPLEFNVEFILNTNNKLAKFLLLIKNKKITKENQIDLANLWVNIDEDLINDWFTVLNKYPARLPHLQLSIGKFLATAKQKQLELYISTLSMETTHSDSVNSCIDAFVKNSSPKVKEEFCKIAYKKWIDWKPENSYKIYRSCIDKLIILYFKEYCNQRARDDFINNNINAILTAHSLWFKKSTDFDIYIYEKLSKIQPACIANYLLENPNKSFTNYEKPPFIPDFFDIDLRWKSWIRI